MTRFQTPAIRQAGLAKIIAWLRRQGAYRPDAIAESAVAGFGPLLGAEFVVGINGDLANFDNADRVSSETVPLIHMS